MSKPATDPECHRCAHPLDWHNLHGCSGEACSCPQPPSEIIRSHQVPTGREVEVVAKALHSVNYPGVAWTTMPADYINRRYTEARAVLTALRP